MAYRVQRPEIRISRIAPDDAETVLNLYAHIFVSHEPLTRWMGLSEERIISIARAMMLNRNNDSLEKGLWLLAADGRSNQPAGFVVCGDILAENPTEPPEGLTPEDMAKLPSLMALMEAIRRPMNEIHTAKPGDCLHISALGIAPGWEGRGLATRLLGSAMDRAGELGFRYSASECTGEASRRCHEKCGYRSLGAVEYGAFEFQGARPFAGMEGECHMMWKEL